MEQHLLNEVRIEDEREKIKKCGINLRKVYDLISKDGCMDVGRVNGSKDSSCLGCSMI